jgi:hypothetical protein
VTAVDWNVEAIEQIRRGYPEIDVRAVDLEQDASVVEAGAFDLVVCWLFHQSNLYPLIRDAVRPGGIAALSELLQGRFAADPLAVRAEFPGWTILHDAETERISELIVKRNS